MTVCAVYPDVDGEPNECRPAAADATARSDNDVNVQFTVRVPAGASFTGRTVNGGIDARDLDGRVTLNTVNGNVEINTASYASVKTVNGSITARLGRADWQDALEMKTVNGSITLHLPGIGGHRREREDGERADPVGLPHHDPARPASAT